MDGKRCPYLFHHSGVIHSPQLYCHEYIRLGNRDKSLLAGNDHIVVAAGTVDNKDIAFLIPPGHDTHVLVIRIKGQVADLCIVPGYVGTVCVLHRGSATMPDDVTQSIVEHPIHIARAVHPVGAIGSAGRTVCGSYFIKLPLFMPFSISYLALPSRLRN